MTPLFLFGLPRSGTTLLQRIVMASGEVASISEGWILLPLLYMDDGDAPAEADYGHEMCARAINELKDHIGPEEWRRGIRGIAIGVYANLCRRGETYALDKTPQYWRIASKIIDLFGDGAKYIFLFRNPLDVLLSFAHWLNGQSWTDILRKHDSLYGYEPLVVAWRKACRNHDAVLMSYENLLDAPNEGCKRLYDSLGLDFDWDKVQGFHAHKPPGTFGDYNIRTNTDLQKFAPSKAWQCKRMVWDGEAKRTALEYLEGLDTGDLAAVGYSLDELRWMVEGKPAPPAET